ncbi:hypothetical protein DPMN_015462 [Dreissena polymorpha]|uniref:Uncharacterized protein n=1 Tax=Dreissena polymorpha TaxID=45954 RepID=A0A9D4NCU9_DREPO|nr:hypothetical protein DPMN_015462 [Dreissena polymorpha]
MRYKQLELDTFTHKTFEEREREREREREGRRERADGPLVCTDRQIDTDRDRHREEKQSERDSRHLGGFTLPFVSVGGLGMPCIPLVAYAVPSSTSDCQTLLKEANKKSLTRDLMCQTRALLICLTVVCSIAVWSILDPILEPFLRKLPPEMIGVIFLVMATTNLIFGMHVYLLELNILSGERSRSSFKLKVKGLVDFRPKWYAINVYSYYCLRGTYPMFEGKGQECAIVGQVPQWYYVPGSDNCISAIEEDA